ncbi:MAG: DUF4279 domain-containing protein [Verrucomicrobiae bacterium]|nr:DUF4279 domain-containing protein [Verrucomicrobiae bacterium]
MYPYDYQISLRIVHPAMDPQVFTETLGLQPRIVQKFGDRRSTPTGTLLEGHYQRSYWSSSFIPPDDSDLPSFLAKTVENLRPHRAFFCHIRDTGGSVEFFVGLFTDGVNIGATLPYALLSDLGDMGIDLSLDIYDYKENSDNSST